MQTQFPFLTQNGPIPPPPFPGLNFPPAPFPQAPLQNVASPGSFYTPPIQPGELSQSRPPAAIDRLIETLDSDKEEGEVSDGDRMSRSPAGNGRAYPEPPRSVPQSSVRPDREREADQRDSYDPNRPAAGQTFQSPPEQAKPRTDSLKSPDTMPQQREEAKQFVRLLHSNNMGYHTLAAEGLDSGPLRDLYRSLNLPSEPEPVPLPKTRDAAPSGPSNGVVTSGQSASLTGNGQTPQPKPSTSVKINIAAIPPAKSAPSPVDRKDYIARLQAAKMAKQATSAKATPPQKTPPATSAVPAAAKAPEPPTVTQAGQAISEEEKARKTELIRQRLEALKKNPSSPASKSANTGAVTNPATISSPAAITQSTPIAGSSAKPQPLPAAAFSGIPGLFMNSPSTAPAVQAPSTPAQNAASAIPSKRPLASDSVDTAPYISDADSGGSEMDLSDSHASKPSAVIPQTISRNGEQNLRTVQSIPDFPFRSASAMLPSSAVSTPGPQTPASLARETELSKKEKELAAMKLALQKRMREQRQKRMEAAAPSSPKPLTGTQESLSSSASQPQPEPPVTAQPEKAPKGNAPVPASSGVIQALSRESKRQRRAEIESGLPALEAEIANNAARMAQLAEEMEQLTAHNERMKQDKGRLIRELESLGIDTEGMPHAELQAKRDEIVRERKAEAELRAQTPEVLAPSSASIEDEAQGRVTLESTMVEPTAVPSNRETSVQGLSHPDDVISSIQQVAIPGLHASVSQPPATLVDSPRQSTRQQDLIPENKSDELPYSPAAAPDMPQPDVAQRTVTTEAMDGETPKAVGLQESATPIDDDEDFYSPAPAHTEPVIDEQRVSATSQLGANSPSEDGEVAMSESPDEEEYEPEQPAILTEPATEAQTQYAQIFGSPGSSTSSSMSTHEDEEVYEPPDFDEPILDDEPHEADASLEATVQHGDAEEGAMNISTPSSDESEDFDSGPQSAAENTNDEFTPFNTGPEQSVPVADDLAPELQSETVPVGELMAEKLVRILRF